MKNTIVCHNGKEHPLGEPCELCQRVDEDFKKSEFYSVSEWIAEGHRKGYSAYLKQQWKDNLDDIVLEIANKYYPETTKDWTERHKFIGMVGEIISKI